MRGTNSMANTVAPCSASASSVSRSWNGLSSPTTIAPGFSAAISSSAGARTLSTMSAPASASAGVGDDFAPAAS